MNRLFPVDLADREWHVFSADGFSEPVCGVIYRSDALKPVCGMPLGGLGTGCIDIEAAGRIGLCTLFKRVWGWDDRNQVFAPGNRVIDIGPAGRGPYDAPFLGLCAGEEAWVLTTCPIEGAATARRIHYWGHYPILDLEYDLDAPLGVGLRAWAPFVPGDADGSSIPGAIFEVRVRNASLSAQRCSLVCSFPGSAPSWPGLGGFTPRQYRAHKPGPSSLAGVEIASERIAYALAAVDDTALRFGAGLYADGSAWSAAAHRLPELRLEPGCDEGASLAVDFALEPGQERVVRFVLAWRTLGWESDFPYGQPQHRYTHQYAQVYASAWDAARRLASEHASLLRRILAWQQVVYSQNDLPVWLRDQLVNLLHLIAEESYWAAAEPPLGEWCDPGGLFALVEGTDAAGQPTCIPCDWYGNFPVVFFFPELARSNLRALRANMRADGAVPFYLGQGLDLNGASDARAGRFAYDRQRTLNGPCYADLVDRLWLCTGDDGVLREFYPSVKQNLLFTQGGHAGAEGVLGVITEGGDEWYESMDMRGITSHAGGVRLAHLRIVERMAEAVGDHDFARQCRAWFDAGSRLLEERLWGDGCYLLSIDPVTGVRNPLVLAFQLDGDWMAGLHGLPGVFRPDRAAQALETIRRLNGATLAGGPLNVVQPDGGLTDFGGRMGGLCSMPASVFILAMNHLYLGQHEAGLEIAYRSLNQLVIELGYTWDMPNMVRSVLPTAARTHRCAPAQEHDAGVPRRIYGHDYYQCMSLWALPAAWRGQSLAEFAAPGGFMRRLIEAATTPM